MRTAAVNISLERTITRKRLSKYLEKTAGDVDLALNLYEENTRLAEAFYTPLQGVEVCLRNCLASELSPRFGENWYENGRPALGSEAIRMIASAIENEGPTPTSGHIVAELKFAFWVGLLARPYDSTLWRQCLFKAFLADGGKS